MVALFPLPGYVAKWQSSERLYYSLHEADFRKVSRRRLLKKQMREYKQSPKVRVLMHVVGASYQLVDHFSHEYASDDQVRRYLFTSFKISSP
jgi:hypothetical protein